MAKLQLNQPGHLVKLPNKLLHYEPTHTSRYLILASLLSQLGTPKDLKILDVGGKKGLLRLFPGFSPTIIDMEESDEPKFVQGNALDMPFKDEEFDFTVSCDVLEHIPQADRKQFINEMLRVSRNGFILCAPFSSPSNVELESELNDYYHHLTNSQHRWLREHIDNGLPSEKALEAHLKDLKIPYVKFRHFSPRNWRLIVQNHLLDTAFGDNENLEESVNKLYEEYYTQMCPFDFAEDGYRTFYWASKTIKPEVVLPSNSAIINATERFHADNTKNITTLLEAEMKSLRFARQERDKIITENVQLKAERDILKEQLSKIKANPVWKAYQLARSVKNHSSKKS